MTDLFIDVNSVLPSYDLSNPSLPPVFQTIANGDLHVAITQYERGNIPTSSTLGIWQGRTVLHYVAFYSNFSEVAKYLIEKDPMLLHVADSAGFTPLHTAAYAGGALEMVCCLLEAGANPAAIDVLGNTPFDVALREFDENGEVIDYMLEMGLGSERSFLTAVVHATGEDVRAMLLNGYGPDCIDGKVVDLSSRKTVLEMAEEHNFVGFLLAD